MKKRKDEICKLVENFYSNNKLPKNKNIEIVKREIIDMYLNTNLSLDEIEAKLMKKIPKNKSLEHKRKMNGYTNIFTVLLTSSVLILLITFYMLFYLK